MNWLEAVPKKWVAFSARAMVVNVEGEEGQRRCACRERLALFLSEFRYRRGLRWKQLEAQTGDVWASLQHDLGVQQERKRM